MNDVIAMSVIVVNVLWMLLSDVDVPSFLSPLLSSYDGYHDVQSSFLMINSSPYNDDS